MSTFLEYDYPVTKSFTDLNDDDLNSVEKLYGKDIRDQYQGVRDHMRFKLRKVKIDRILNEIKD